VSAQTDRLARRLRGVAEAVRATVQPALMQSGEEIAGTMRSLAPVDTGELRDSITVTPGGRSTPPYSQPGGFSVVPITAVAITAGGVDVRYPHLVEYGTAEAPAQPFFWPGYRLLRKRAGARVKRAIRKAVRQGWDA
jgi:HK97 gp10 family phage protein